MVKVKISATVDPARFERAKELTGVRALRRSTGRN